MSHSTVLVISPNYEEALKPFDEGIQVEPYDDKCWCVGRKARNEAREAAEKVSGTTINELRDKYHAIPEEERQDWPEFISEYVKAKDEANAAHPDKDKADPECEECNGTGTVKSTYNPKSKWDWYQLGGRWNGYFKLKDGEIGAKGEPGLMGSCSTHDPKFVDQACKGAIDFEGTLEARRQESRKYYQSVKADPEDNPFNSIKKGMTEDEYVADASLATFAVLKDDVWYERGDMGWWGCVRDEKDPDEWEREFAALIEDLPDDAVLSVVDVHI